MTGGKLLCGTCRKPIGKIGLLMPSLDQKKRQMCRRCAGLLFPKPDRKPIGKAFMLKTRKVHGKPLHVKPDLKIEEFEKWLSKYYGDSLTFMLADGSELLIVEKVEELLAQARREAKERLLKELIFDAQVHKKASENKYILAFWTDIESWLIILRNPEIIAKTKEREGK